MIPKAAVKHATAKVGEVAGFDSTVSATAGPMKATVCKLLRTAVTDQPRATSPSASQPAAELPTAITVQGSNDRNADDFKSSPSTFCSTFTQLYHMKEHIG